MNYTIADISKKLNIPSSTLRYYEDLGLITDVKRSSSGHRVYEKKHIERLEAIECFKKAKMTMSEIQDFFKYEENCNDSIDDMMALLTNRKGKLLEEFSSLYEAYAHILKKLDYYGQVEKSIKASSQLPTWNDYDKKSYEDAAMADILSKINGVS
jgi:DNA-binding transcriptional MerR regulator